MGRKEKKIKNFFWHVPKRIKKEKKKKAKGQEKTLHISGVQNPLPTYKRFGEKSSNFILFFFYVLDSEHSVSVVLK